MKYTDFVSDEPLDLIESEECDHGTGIVTSRFRRVFNELYETREALEVARETLLDASTWFYSLGNGTYGAEEVMELGVDGIGLRMNAKMLAAMDAIDKVLKP